MTRAHRDKIVRTATACAALLLGGAALPLARSNAVAATAERAARVDRLCELNVVEQVANVCQTTIVQGAWERGQDLTVHGWIYGLHDGLVRDLNVSRSG